MRKSTELLLLCLFLIWPFLSAGQVTVNSPDGKYSIRSSKTDGITYVYVKDSQELKAILPFVSAFICFTADAKIAYVLHSKTFWNAYLAVYRTDNWQLLQERLISKETTELAVNRDNSLLLAVGGRMVRVMDPGDLSIKKINWENERLHHIVFNPNNGTQYAGVSRNNRIEVRDLSADTLVKIFPEQPAKVAQLQYSADGQQLISLDADHKRREWLLADSTIVLSYLANKRVSIAPVPILGYNPEMNVIVGLGLNIVFNTENKVKELGYARPSAISPAISYGFNGQVYMNLLADYFTKSGWHLVNDIGFLNNNRSYFFGIGHDASRHDRSLYRNDVLLLEGTLSKSIVKRFYGGIRYRLRDDKRLDFNDPSAALSAGMHGGLLAGVGLLLQYDTRNDLFFPTQGHFIDFTYMHYNHWLSSDYRFNELKLDFRYYFPLVGSQKGTTFAIQGLYHSTFGGTVPFYQLPYLSADRMMRGIWHNLYIDKQALAVQGEMRSTFSAIDQRFGYVLFSGIGDVAPDFFNGYHPKPIGFFGLGLRRQLLPKLKLQSRLDGTVTTRGDLGFFGGVGIAF